MSEKDQLTLLVAAMLTGNTNPGDEIIAQCVAFAKVAVKKISEAAHD
jgi:hypothetical protein